jgi:phosphoglycolate phosphatase
VRKRLLLWDVDGTLLRAGVHNDVFEAAIEAAVGSRPDMGMETAGKTDPHIAREYLQAMDVGDIDEAMVAVLRSLEEALAARVDLIRERGRVCLGVPELLERCAANHQVVSTVLTGNLAANAVIKLSTFGLDRWLDLEVGAYGSDHADRNQLVPVAMERVAEQYEVRLEPSDVWVIGDTPRDLDCARAAGARCLLVATGNTPASVLGALGAEAVLSDLSDTEAVLKLLLGDL